MTTATITQQVLHPSADLPLTVREAGAGSPVLVLHGGAGPATVTPVVDHLADRHHVLAPTHPGWNGTPRPERLRTVGDLAEAYLDLLASLPGDVTVIGSSFGGWIAAEMAVRDRKGRIGRLALVGAIGPRPATSPAPPASTPAAGRGPSAEGLALLQTYTEPAMSDPGLLSRLATVRIPVLVLWGQLDPVVPPAYGRAYADAFPDARFSIVPGAGHLPTSEAPEAAFAVLDSFTDPAIPA